jgi:putative hydrolase of the HAD superfamily
MSPKVTTIGFDADDTLWHNDRFFQLTHARFASILAPHCDVPDLMDALLQAEKRNIGQYGFGIKGFVLSMIETALEVTKYQVPGEVIAELLDAGKEMLAHPIELLPFAAEAVEAARSCGLVVLITKGDLLDQERKLAQSGLGDLFDGVEIVSAKIPSVYTRIFDQHGTGAAQGMMIGNSMKSDVNPMLDAGGWGIYVQHGQHWEIEHAEPQLDHPRYKEIENLGALPDLITEILKD